MNNLVALYTRVSSEDLETPLSTRRQERACRQFAKSKGWKVADVWEDVDVSAYAKGKRRPAFDNLMSVVAGGKVDGVLVWKLDRLVRRPADFERFWTRCDKAGVFLASATEPIDSTTELGLAVIRILVTFANVESTSIGLRLRSRMEEKARAGIPLVQGRGFGFNDTWTAVLEDEAALIHEAAARFLAGETFVSIATDWRRRQLLTSRGAPWTGQKLQRVLNSPRLVGDNTFNGVVVARGCFPAILDPLTSAQIRARVSDARRLRGPPLRFLLSSGLLRCGTCGARMHGFTYARGGGRDGVRSYACGRRGPTGHRLYINAEVVEALVVEQTLARLERRAKMRPTIALPADVPDQLAVAYEAHATAMRTLAIDYYVHRRLTTEEWEAARDGLEEQLGHARRLHTPAWQPPPGRANKRQAGFRGAWETLDLLHRRDIIASELRYATITPRIGGRVIDAQRVRPTWWDDHLPLSARPARKAGCLDADVWDGSRWIGTGEAAAILAMSPAAVRAMVHSGQLPVVKHRRIFRFLRSDVEAAAARFAKTIGTAEAAAVLGVSQHRIDHWIEDGLLPAEKRGGFYRVGLDDLRTFGDSLRAVRTELVDTNEAARILGRSVPWLIEMVERGSFECIRYGRIYLLRRDQVEAAAAGRNAEDACVTACARPVFERPSTSGRAGKGALDKHMHA